MSRQPGLPFYKFTGTGNDFLMIDLREQPLSTWTTLDRAELAKRIANRRFGVGADGVVFIEYSSDARLKWDFFNDDGSHAEMCGNATRCMGRWAREVLNQGVIDFTTVVGPVSVMENQDVYSSILSFVRIEPHTLTHLDPRFKGTAVLVNTGVPHAVVETDSVHALTNKDPNITAFRFHPDAGPRGANVTFLERVGKTSFKTVTFERGVEDFTLSCGTGVLAAAAVGLGVSSLQPPSVAMEADVEAPGGKLKVKFEKGLSAVVLTGPARTICTGVIDEEMLR